MLKLPIINNKLTEITQPEKGSIQKPKYIIHIFSEWRTLYVIQSQFTTIQIASMIILQKLRNVRVCCVRVRCASEWMQVFRFKCGRSNKTNLDAKTRKESRKSFLILCLWDRTRWNQWLSGQIYKKKNKHWQENPTDYNNQHGNCSQLIYTTNMNSIECKCKALIAVQ